MKNSLAPHPKSQITDRPLAYGSLAGLALGCCPPNPLVLVFFLCSWTLCAGKQNWVGLCVWSCAEYGKPGIQGLPNSVASLTPVWCSSGPKVVICVCSLTQTTHTHDAWTRSVNTSSPQVGYEDFWSRHLRCTEDSLESCWQRSGCQEKPWFLL